MTARISTINLLPADKFEFSPLGRFLLWMLSTGRVIVVLTELVVIIAFLSRFWFDRRRENLLELRIQRSEIIQNLQTVQTKWEKTQFLARAVSQAAGDSFDAAAYLGKIQSLSPAGTNYESIDVSSHSATLRGSVDNSSLLPVLLLELKREISSESVSVTRLEQAANQSTNFDFDIEVKIKPETL
jgi:hypothetical protein